MLYIFQRLEPGRGVAGRGPVGRGPEPGQQRRRRQAKHHPQHAHRQQGPALSRYTGDNSISSSNPYVYEIV